MDAASILLALAAAGVNFGLQPAEEPTDGYEYVVQIEPELLDVLQRGESVPIESNVPPEIAPIRKVSIVVGRADLPRKTLGSVNHTAYFAGETAWTPDRYGASPPAAAGNNQRYPAPSIGATGVAPPPSVLDRAQAAVTETGNTLRDGVEAGIRAANEQLSNSGGQVLDATRGAGQDLGQRLQNWTNEPGRQLQSTGSNLRSTTERTLGEVGNQLQQVTNPFAPSSSPPAAGLKTQSGIAPPPWPAATATSDQAPSGRAAVSAPATARTQTSSGWTSIGSTVAAPPLIIPQLATATRSNAAVPTPSTRNAGPAFPVTAPDSRQPIHSELADPSGQRSAPLATDNWAGGWAGDRGTQPATIGREANTPSVDDTAGNRGLVPVQPVHPPAGDDQQTAGAWEDRWADSDLWSQPPQSIPADPTPARPVDARAADSSTVANNGDIPAGPIAAAPPGGTTPRAAERIESVRAADDPPWLPLLLVSLSLMGSLSANLFLGWSYIDARQKYRSLVRKTADTFRRATSGAAKTNDTSRSI